MLLWIVFAVVFLLIFILFNLSNGNCVASGTVWDVTPENEFVLHFLGACLYEHFLLPLFLNFFSADEILRI